MFREKFYFTLGILLNVFSQVLPGSKTEPGLRKDEDNKDPVIQAFAGLNYAKRPTKRRG